MQLVGAKLRENIWYWYFHVMLSYFMFQILTCNQLFLFLNKHTVHTVCEFCYVDIWTYFSILLTILYQFQGRCYWPVTWANEYLWTRYWAPKRTGMKMNLGYINIFTNTCTCTKLNFTYSYVFVMFIFKAYTINI